LPQPEPSETNASAPATAQHAGLRQALPSLVLDAALPILVFQVLVRLGVSTLVSVAAGGVFPAAHIVYGWIRLRRVETLGLIVLAIMGIGTATSLMSGSVFFVLAKESVFTALFGALCLGSLLAEHPFMFHVMRPFVAGDDPELNDWWDGLWADPSFRKGVRFVTVVWGGVYLVEAVARVVFALLLSPATVVAASPLMALGVTIGLIAWTRRFLVAIRRRRMREVEIDPAG
jgi:intracellular septation protein A